MLLESIYLLIYNNLQCLYTRNYFIELIKTTFIFISIYTLPIFIFEYIINLSEIDIINTVSRVLYTYLYFLPSYAVIYVLHNTKLAKLLETKYIVYNNPHHLYLTILYGFIYLICALLSFLFNNNFYIFHVCDTFGLSLFYNEIGYTFLDTSEFYYSNRIDFYNSNYNIFLFYGLITSLAINNLPQQLFIPGSYIITSFIQNIFINYKYNKFDPSVPLRNIMYYFEKIFNIVITFISTFIFFSFQKRTIINEPI